MGAATSKPDVHARQRGSEEATADRPLDILFVMRSLKSLRFHQATLESMTDRGHNVRLLLEEDRHGPTEQSWLERMNEQPNFICDIAGPKRDPWRKRRLAIRKGMEYVHFLGTAFRGMRLYAFKAERRSPPALVQRVARLPLVRTRLGLRGLHGILSAIERAFPPQPEPAAYMAGARADVVVLGSADNRASEYAAYGAEARARGIPVAICVASWDNLTTRPRMRFVPDALLVWNHLQVQEAVKLHHIPAEQVVVTGAPNFDQWFSWKPRPRSEFLARVGLDRAKPVVLWVGGALHNWETPEPVLVKAWLRALRSSEDPILRDVGVILRPHPLRLEHWRSDEFLPFENVVMWPPEDVTMPTSNEQKADFYDSIYHSAAVVGVNTSAMIEASIIGRPVLAILDPDHHDSQLGSLHFSYLVESAGPALGVAASIEELLDDLGALVAGRVEETPEHARRFVTQFVRPNGIERAATPFSVDAIERLACSRVPPRGEPFWIAPLRALIVLPGQLEDLFVRARGAIVPTRRQRSQRPRRFEVVRGAPPADARANRARQIRRLFNVHLRAAVRARLRRLSRTQETGEAQKGRRSAAES